MSTSINLIEYHELKPYNSFAVSAKARYFARVESLKSLTYLFEHHIKTINSHNPSKIKKNNMPILVLGGGSNILFTTDFPGLVIQNAISDIELIKEDSKHVWIKASAGTSWHQLVLFSVEKNYGGIENLSLIPGSVGAAPVQNIGAYGVELKDHFESLEAIHIESHQIKTFSRDDCDFGYRNSIFKNRLKNEYIILNITLKLDKEPTFKLTYGAIQETLKNLKIETPSVKSISDAIIALRESKLPDPSVLPNAGSFFKNPYISPERFFNLKKSYPSIPSFKTENDELKIPAAWLIEQCQWKGKRLAKTGVYHKQAVVLANYDGASGHDILQLSKNIQSDVYEKFAIELVPEVTIL